MALNDQQARFLLTDYLARYAFAPTHRPSSVELMAMLDDLSVDTDELEDLVASYVEDKHGIEADTFDDEDDDDFDLGDDEDDEDDD